MAADSAEAGESRNSRRILCLTGPESTGKTTLATALAERLGGQLVAEVARDYLAGRVVTPAMPYDAADLLRIARLQVKAEADAMQGGTGLLICDTDLTVIRIWWEEKFGSLPAELEDALAARLPRAYLLLKPDLPWVADPQRENPLDRERLYCRYQALLAEGEHPYAEVTGSGAARLANALAAIAGLYPEAIV